MPTAGRVRLLCVVPLLLFGFSSGLPLALTGSTLQAWFASQHIGVMTIGLLTLAGQPYVYKFLWAPFLDRYVPPLWGRRRGWIGLMQLCLAIVITVMAFGHPKEEPWFLAVAALFVAFFSATQDLAIDAYRTDLLLPTERGLGSALFVTGYRVAMLVSGGLALIIADHYGFRVTYWLMAGLMVVSVMMTWLSPEPERATPPVSLRDALVIPLREFFQRPQVAGLIIFLILYKIGDAYTVSLSTAFLIETLHFSLSVVGSINKIVGLLAAILGSILGGFLLVRMRLYRGLLYFGVGQALCSFLYFALAVVGKSVSLLAATVFADNLFSGMSSVALLAFITGLCDKRFSATQFALLSAVTTLPRILAGPLAGFSVQAMGWPPFFIFSFFVSLPGLWLLMRLRNSYNL